MVCFTVGKENPSLWLHYQIMICIFTAEMNNNKGNVKYVEHKHRAVTVMWPLRDFRLSKCRTCQRAQQRCEKLADYCQDVSECQPEKSDKGFPATERSELGRWIF